jgi:hypothetical protein
MASAPFNVTLSADAAATAIESIYPGQEFSVWVSGTWGSGTLAIQGDSDGAATKKTLVDGSWTADAHKILVNPSTTGRLWYVLTGSTSPDLDLVILPIVSEGA